MNEYIALEHKHKQQDYSREIDFIHFVFAVACLRILLPAKS